MIHSLDRTRTDMGVHINTKKTKIMAVLSSTSDLYSHPQPVLLPSDKEHVEVMEYFEYLGSGITSSCTLDKDVGSHISKASKLFSSLSRILWYQRKISLKNKVHMFMAVIMPTVLYGCETWVPTASHLRRLQRFVMRWLIFRVSVKDKLCNTAEIRAKAGMMMV